MNRGTLETPPAIQGFTDTSQIGPWITQQENALGSPPIVIVQTTRLGALVQNDDESDPFNAALRQIGGGAYFPFGTYQGNIAPPWPFVTVGVAGLAPGSATQSCAPLNSPAPPPTPPRCVINGWFSSPTGPTSHYSFTSGDYVPFAIHPTPSGSALNNTITVGNQSIAAPPFPAGSLGGYHVVVLDRYSLQVLADDSFATGDPGSGPTAQQAMLNTLTAAVDDDTQMVLLTSVGQPVSASSRDPAVWTAIMAAISELGGTPDVFARVQGPQTYSLVGIANGLDYGHVAEASSVAQAAGTPLPSGAISGVLQRTNESLFEPVSSSPGTPETALYSAIYRPATPWPDSSAADYANASLYLAQQLLPGEGFVNVRDAYSSLTATGSWTGLVSRLKSIPYPGTTYQPSFSAAEFNQLVGDYAGTVGVNPRAGEFAMVDEVNRFFQTTIEQPFTDSGLPDYVSLQDLATEIQGAVNPPTDSKSASDILAIIQGFVDVAGVFAGPLDDITSFVSGAFGIASGATSDPATGAPTETAIQATTVDLAGDIVARQNQILQTFDTLGEIAVSDYGRLAAMDEIITGLDWTPGVSNSLSQYLQAAERQQIATALTTTNWTLPATDVLIRPPTWITRPGDTTATNPPAPLTDLRDWECSQDFDTIHPYNQMAPSTEYSSITNWDASGNPLRTTFFIVPARFPGNPGINQDNVAAMQCSRHWPLHDLASGPVFNALFAPTGSTVPGTNILGFGLYPATWWWQNFTNGQCWRTAPGDQSPDPAPNCAPYTTSYNPAPAWTH